MFAQVVGISVAVFASVMSSSMLAIAYPHMAHDFGLPFSLLMWRTVVFFAIFSGCIPFFGKLADRIVVKRQLQLGLILFIASSLGSFLFAHHLFWVPFLALQGLMALADAMMVPAQVALIQKIVPADKRGWAFGVFSAVLSLATLVAPALGGFFVAYWGWSSLFLVLAFVALLALLMISWLVHVPRALDLSAKWRYQPALRTTILLVTLIASCQFPFYSEFPIWSRTLGIFVILVTVLLLIWNETRTSAPERLFKGAMFANHEFRKACVRVFLYFVVVNAVAIFVPSFLQQTHGLNPQTLGLIIVGESFVVIGLGPLSGSIADKKPYATLGLGILIFIVALWALVMMRAPAHWVLLLCVYLLIGLASSLSSPAQSKIAMNASPENEVGNYMGVFQLLQFVSGAFAAGALSQFYSPRHFEILVICLVFILLVALALAQKGTKQWVLLSKIRKIWISSVSFILNTKT